MKTKKVRKKGKFIFLKRTFKFFIIMFLLGTISVGTLIFNILKNTQAIDPTKMGALIAEESILYDANSVEIEKIKSVESRTIVKIEDVPDHLKKAVLAIEDDTFYEHNGFNPKRIVGALIQNIKLGYKAQGASTINQQVSKILYLTTEKTYERKIKELYYSILLDQKLSKDQILQTYLNIMYLGRGATGVQSAAKTYFDKDVSDLNLAESALLAGITKYPTKYEAYKAHEIKIDDDFKNMQPILYAKEVAVSDTNKIVYEKLFENNLINKTDYDLLMNGRKVAYKVVFNEKSLERQDVVLRRMLELNYITEAQYNEARNYEIKIKIGKKNTSEISSYFADFVENDVISALIDKGYTQSEAENLIYNGGLRIYSTMDIKMQKILEEEYKKSSNFPGTFTDSNGQLQPQSAMVIMEQSSGEIKALIGGRMIGGEKLYNRALKPRQPGSSIKPLASYMPAVINGDSPSTLVDDSRMYNKKGEPYPNNYNFKYKGKIPMREAIKISSNVGAARVGLSLEDTESESIEKMITFLEELGITSIVRREDNRSVNDENLSLTLGGMSKGVSPLEMTAAYSTIANYGRYTKPLSFTRVELSDGTTLLENKIITKQLFSPESAYLMTDMLKDVVSEGTGKRAQLNNAIVAGKTGTTSNKYDAWFVGYSPYYTAATWIGVDIPRPLNSGSAMAASLWNRVMSRVHANLEHKDFEKPEKIIELKVCSSTGKLASEYDKKSGKVKTEIFIEGYEPTEVCTKHKEIQKVEEKPTSETDKPTDIDTELPTEETDSPVEENPKPVTNGNSLIPVN